METFARQTQLRDDPVHVTTRLQELAKGTAPQTVTFLLLCAAAWILLRPYDGLVSDAQLYALQALANLQPDTLAGDIFLKYGSQNDFTLFPRIYAFLVRDIGLEHAAALLTLTCSLLWLAMGWRVARRLSSKDMAWLALGLLIAIKAWYGAYQVFRGGEMFLSARLPAEVLSLAAIAAYLDGRRILAGVLVVISGMLHPLMAMPVVMFLLFMSAGERWGVRSLKVLFPVLILGGTVATLMLSGNDDASANEWLLALRTRSLFLFPVEWTFQDWQYLALVLATICLAYASARSETLARFASSMVLLGLVGIGLAAIAGALPEHEALLKIQPWRWLWPVVVSAIILLPGAIDVLWHEGTLSVRRTCAVLLLASWMTMDTFGGILALGTLGVFLMQPRVSNPGVLRALRIGAWLVLAATFVSLVVTIWQCALFPLDTNLDPRWMQRMANALPTNSTAVAAILACWLMTRLAARFRPTLAFGIACAASLLLLFMPRAHRTWTTERFSPETYGAFAPWRAILPESSEVLWSNNPTGVWVLLERRSYMSGEQLAGLLYSPKLTAELQVRAEALKSLVDPGWWTMASLSKDAEPRELTPDLLSQVCRAPGLDYVVDHTQIEGYVAKATFPVERVDVYLYDCRLVGKPGNAT